jgi:hypothetical protein
MFGSGSGISMIPDFDKKDNQHQEKGNAVGPDQRETSLHDTVAEPQEYPASHRCRPGHADVTSLSCPDHPERLRQKGKSDQYTCGIAKIFGFHDMYGRCGRFERNSVQVKIRKYRFIGGR